MITFNSLSICLMHVTRFSRNMITSLTGSRASRHRTLHEQTTTWPPWLEHAHFTFCHCKLLLLLMIWQSPGLPGWWKVNFITVTHRPHHPNIVAALYCLATSPGFLPTLCEKWSGFFYVHRVFLSYTRDRRLKVSSERLGNEDKAPCPRALLPGQGSNRGPPVWKSEALTARPRPVVEVKSSRLDPPDSCETGKLAHMVMSRMRHNASCGVMRPRVV